MEDRMTKAEAIGLLRAALGRMPAGLSTMISAQPVVQARYQPIFRSEGLPKLTKEDFHSFLIYRNNQHWVGLHRKGPEICSDMPRLRRALGILLDESRPIAARLDELSLGGRNAVHGMGRGILTPILLVMYPQKYGVWNNRSQGSMEQLGLWPTFERGLSFGQRYAKLNELLLELASEIGTDLWTLDGLWWAVFPEEGETPADPVAVPVRSEVEEDGSAQSFGLERHLHDFLTDNWDRTSLGKDWDLHAEDGEVVGYEYPTPIGRIDLLARHKREKRWLVIELKRGQSSDSTVGQALRYMGYVREHLAGSGEAVEGMIIAQAGDDRIRYALEMMPSVNLMLYEVEFRLKPARAER